MQKSEPPGAATPGGSLCLLALAVFQFTPLREGRPGGFFYAAAATATRMLDRMSMPNTSLYYRVVVIKAPLQGLCYTVRDAVDW